ncbi:hypothetical protein EON63_19750, partial [archaeon]
MSSESSFLPRKSFTEICKQHSILSKWRADSEDEGEEVGEAHGDKYGYGYEIGDGDYSYHRNR